MKIRDTILLIIFLFSLKLFGNGAAIVNSVTPEYLSLLSSNISVIIDNQVAQITTIQTFHNLTADSTFIKYAFPLPQGASATELSWFMNGSWETANISAEPQDTTLPGGNQNEVHYTTAEFLGESPLFFSIKNGIPADSVIVVKLKYVQLLKYEFGRVSFNYPNNYLLIQPSPLLEQNFMIQLNSGRTIESIEMKNHIPMLSENKGFSANLNYEALNEPADADYEIEYTLSKEELGLFGFSTMLADSIVFDKEYGAGYFTFVVEPNPEDYNSVIDKVFTLIIDRSGSMGGTKIEQAREAAAFIINHLNPNDKFNIVDFESDVRNFRSSHVINSSENRKSALEYIERITSGGGTNISGALSRAISQYSNANEETANIIIFFTDGQASTGLTDTDDILNHVKDEMNNYQTEITLFSFGIGGGANRQLLTQLASQNNGLAQFLENDQLEESITEFYLKIKSPVLLDTEISFSQNGISEVYPNPLPSLYQGQQMIVSGRYTDPKATNIRLSGNAFGREVEYNYNLSLSDSTVIKNQFLTKIWAKQKIEHLMVRYHSLDYNSPQADSLHEVIQTLSIAYGIITEFTSFIDNSDLTDVEETDFKNNDEQVVDDFKLLGNYPNPFNPSTRIRFSVGQEIKENVSVKIYNSIGQLIKVLEVRVNGQGIYEITWNGITDQGDFAPSGVYIYTIDFGTAILSGKMILMK